MEDIDGRDSMIRQLEEDKKETEKHLSDLEGKITEFQKSFWGRMYDKRMR